MKITVYVSSTKNGKFHSETWTTFNGGRDAHQAVEDGLAALGYKWNGDAKADESTDARDLRVTIGIRVDGGNEADAGQTVNANQAGLVAIQTDAYNMMKSYRGK